jgi:Signal transduction histidine kinase
VLHDITEIRRLENIRREFVANVSHELKTPLAAIQGSAETLLDGAMEDPEYGRKFLQRILEHSERLHSLIMDMLRLARIESESSAFQFTQVDLSHIIEESINAHQEMADHKNIQLTVKSSSLAPVVMGDAEGLRTILDNLVVNGIKYTPEGGKVQVSWHIDRKMVQVEVKDTGIGIPHEHQQRIFERFYRVDAARSRELGGTGLGLSIVKHLAQMFDGSVSVESKPFEGSRFIVRLPQAEVTASVTAN